MLSSGASWSDCSSLHHPPTNQPTNNQAYRWPAPNGLRGCRLVAKPRGSNSSPSSLPLASGPRYTYALSPDLRPNCIPTVFVGSGWHENPMAVGIQGHPPLPSHARDPLVPKVDRAPDQEAVVPAPRPRDRPRLEERPAVPVICRYGSAGGR